MAFNLEHRGKRRVGTPGSQRRCYNGCYHYSDWEEIFTYWGVLEYEVPADKVESRLKFWKELNDYAVSQRGEFARKEYRVIENKENDSV